MTMFWKRATTSFHNLIRLYPAYLLFRFLPDWLHRDTCTYIPVNDCAFHCPLPIFHLHCFKKHLGIAKHFRFTLFICIAYVQELKLSFQLDFPYSHETVMTIGKHSVFSSLDLGQFICFFVSFLK